MRIEWVRTHDASYCEARNSTRRLSRTPQTNLMHQHLGALVDCAGYTKVHDTFNPFRFPQVKLQLPLVSAVSIRPRIYKLRSPIPCLAILINLFSTPPTCASQKRTKIIYTYYCYTYLPVQIEQNSSVAQGSGVSANVSI